MANLQEQSTFDDVYQLEVTDAVIGGPNGTSNRQAKALANRTKYLNEKKAAKDANLSDLTDKAAARQNLGLGTAATRNNEAFLPSDALANAAFVPVGTALFVIGNTTPAGYLKMNGATLNRASYPALWAYAQNNLAPGNDTFNFPGLFGEGDGVNTFKLPDVRGWFPRFWNDGGAVDADYGRAVGSRQWDKVGYHQHAQIGASYLSYSAQNKPMSGHVEENQNNTPGWSVTPAGKTGMLNSTDTDSAYGETIVRNIALLGVIKY